MSKVAFDAVSKTATVIPVVRRIMGDHLTPVLAYRRLVAKDDRVAASFLFESVENGDEVGRFSFLGTCPAVEIIAKENKVTIHCHERGIVEERISDNPIEVARELSESWVVGGPIASDDLPLPSFLGGWVGYAGYDIARFYEIDVLPFENAPTDDRDLPDLHLALYKTIVIFDHVSKVVHVAHNSIDCDGDTEGAWSEACTEIDKVIESLQCE
ncbi:MAG: hypothetical protein QGF07_03415 [Phycisphaerales bacterium]|nr:hypothetical protein [Phycisphaerales bacterium]